MPRLIEVRPLSDYQLYLKYDDGTAGSVDLQHLVGRGVFSAWADHAFFQSVALHPETGAVRWNDELELCPDALFLQLTKKSPEELFPVIQQAESYA